MPLVELKKISPRIICDIVYATERNFTGLAVYPKPCCFLQSSVAIRLHKVQQNLEFRGLGLKIFDGYRPLSVQKIFWEICPDPTRVANPATGSKHNRGAAVDVTLVDPSGQELLMPSGYDEFTERANRAYHQGSLKALHHRQILQDAMELEGFIALPEEWWHFDDPDWERYPILDISFDDLVQFNKSS